MMNDKKRKSVEEILEKLSVERRESIEKLREILKDHLPDGFEETVSGNMFHYVVPLSVYPKGYHAKPDEPLPFISLASQKNHIALYHMGIYMYPELLEWFENEYVKRVPTKLDMGKSCIRFKNTKHIPYDLIVELSEKITVENYINKYESIIKNT